MPSILRGRLPDWIFTAVYLCLLAVPAALLWAVPLMPYENDSAWYQMNQYYVFKGRYVWEGHFSSFKGVALVFPMGGYSLLLIAARGLQNLTRVSWTSWLRLIQLAMYGLTGWFVYRIGRSLSSRLLGIGAASLYLLAFPMLYYAAGVMSETLAAFYIGFVAWGMVEGIVKRRYWPLAAAFFVLGAASLVRPVVVLAAPALLGLLYFTGWRDRRSRIWLVLPMLFLLAPMSQLAANRAMFGAWTIRSGGGLNLWNRVIDNDASIPKRSALAARVELDLRRKLGSGIEWGSWWSICAQLSRAGYSQEEAFGFCRRVALQGLLENKLRYLTNSLMLLARYVFSAVPASRVYPSYGCYAHQLARYEYERQHVPLARKLGADLERFSRGRLQVSALRMYWRWRDLFARAESMGIQVVLGVLFLLWAAIMACSPRRASLGEIAVLVLIVAVLLGSSLCERFNPRFKAPVLPLMILGACIAFSRILSWIRCRLIHRGWAERACTVVEPDPRSA